MKTVILIIEEGQDEAQLQERAEREGYEVVQTANHLEGYSYSGYGADSWLESQEADKFLWY